MIRLLLEPVNLLILDEPTNHLDIKTKGILKEAVKDFDGTVIVVSHDRDFLDGLVEKVYEFGGGEVRENLGGIYEFLRSKNLKHLNELELSKSNSSAQEPTDRSKAVAQGNISGDNPEVSKSKISYAEQKEREKLLRRLRKAVEEAEKNVSAYETQLAEIEKLIAAGDASAETLDKYNQISKSLENAMSVWELSQTELDNIDTSNVK